MDRILSVSTAPFDGYDLSVAISEIARLGIRYVEPAFIQGYTDPFCEDVFSPANAKRILKLLKEEGVSCFALSAHMDLGSDDAVSIFTRRMEFARQLGAKVIVTNAAPSDSRELFLRNIETLARTAESLDLVIGLENPGDGKPNLVNGGADGAALIRQIGSEPVRLNYDFGNVISHFLRNVDPKRILKMHYLTVPTFTSRTWARMRTVGILRKSARVRLTTTPSSNTLQQSVIRFP